MIDGAGHDFLRDTIRLAMDVENRERAAGHSGDQSPAAGTTGRNGRQSTGGRWGIRAYHRCPRNSGRTDRVLRQFSNLPAVALGIGTAFVSTFYGLALANLLLLPAAHRIRAGVAETFELEEMMVEGGLCLFDGIHPSLVRERLNNFLRTHGRPMKPKYLQAETAGRDRWMISYLDVLTILLIFFVAVAAKSLETSKAANRRRRPRRLRSNLSRRRSRLSHPYPIRLPCERRFSKSSSITVSTGAPTRAAW